MANIKISEITTIEPIPDFNFLGVNVTNRNTPINNTISFNSISANIYNTTYNAANKNTINKVLELSTALSNDIKLSVRTIKTDIDKIYDGLDKRAYISSINLLCNEISSLSSNLCIDIGISVDNLSSELTTQYTEMHNVSAFLDKKFDTISSAITSELCVNATANSLGMVKFRKNDDAPDDHGYVKCGLTGDSEGSYILVLSSTAGGGGGGGSTPIGYQGVVLSALHGEAANILVTADDDKVGNLSNEYQWYYISVDTSDDTSESITIPLKSVKSEIIRSIENRAIIEKDLDTTNTNLESLTDTVQNILDVFPLGVDKTYNKVLISSDISAITGAFSVIENNASTTEIGSEPIQFLKKKYGDEYLAGTCVLLTSLKTYYKKIITKLPTEESKKFEYTWIIYNDNNATLFYDKLKSDARYVKYTDIATSSKAGVIKIGYTKSDENYPVAVDTDGKAYVNVPATGTLTIDMLKQIYPVGAVYTSISSTNPASVFKFGTWSNITDSSVTPWTTKTLYAFERTT